MTNGQLFLKCSFSSPTPDPTGCLRQWDISVITSKISHPVAVDPLEKQMVIKPMDVEVQ